jgi:hypothetical protein
MLQTALEDRPSGVSILLTGDSRMEFVQRISLRFRPQTCFGRLLGLLRVHRYTLFQGKGCQRRFLSA